MTPGFNDHQIHALIHVIHERCAYKDPPFSISQVMETIFPEVGVLGIGIEDHGHIEVYRHTRAGRRALISYCDRDHHSTQRFTIAHELGHYILDFDHGRKLESIVCTRRDWPERRADYFAAELLAPLHVLDRFVQLASLPDKDDDDAQTRFRQQVQRLASRFNLPMPTMKRRVRDLLLWRKILRVASR